MDAADTKAYRNKSQAELVKAIEQTKTLSQLFALIQKEHIQVQMHAQSGASNLKPKKLSRPVPVTETDNPFQRFKEEVIKSVTGVTEAPKKGYIGKPKDELLKAVDECTSLSQLFALIQHEDITIYMHANTDASSLNPRKLIKLTANDIISKKDTPFERLKTEVRKAVSERDE
ncbi:MAG TPA: hypothetical protein DEO32_01645 [Ruminococcaceae bacterium]|nr:hypothetical protein [Oscillospiraceae bacterium]